MKLIPPIHRHRHWLAAGLLTGLLVIALVTGSAPSTGGAGAWRQFNPIVHWRGGINDWLFVIDRQSDRVVVYDATDGRPLCRLGTAMTGELKPCSRDLLEADDGQGDFTPPSSQRMAASAR